METATRNYLKIEKEAQALSKIEEAIAEFDASLEDIINGNWSVYSNSGKVQIYTWRTNDEAKEECASMIMAMVEAFGEAERSKCGNDIMYTWSDAIGDMDVEMQVPPVTTGCKLVEKVIVVPAQAETTRTVYEIECDKTTTEKVE